MNREINVVTETAVEADVCFDIVTTFEDCTSDIIQLRAGALGTTIAWIYNFVKSKAVQTAMEMEELEGIPVAVDMGADELGNPLAEIWLDGKIVQRIECEVGWDSLSRIAF